MAETCKPDANLKKAVSDAIKKVDPTFNKSDITVADCKKLTSLNAYNKDINKLEGLQFCTNLTSLDLDDNELCSSGAAPCTANMNVIAGLTNLTWLSLTINSIDNISALKTLIKLTVLGLSGNNISNILALKDLTKLTWLSLTNSKDIYDIYPLVLNANNGGFSADDSVIYLDGIPAVTKTIKKTEIEALEAKGITVHYDGDGK